MTLCLLKYNLYSNNEAFNTINDLFDPKRNIAEMFYSEIINSFNGDWNQELFYYTYLPKTFSTINACCNNGSCFG